MPTSLRSSKSTWLSVAIVTALVVTSTSFADGFFSPAEELSQKSTKQNEAKEPYDRGTDYYYGKGVKQDYVEAKKWFIQAAEQGDLNAQYALGWMYLGNGAEGNYSEAFKWFLKAAKHGHAQSQTALGLMYSKGKGVKENDAEAAKWFRKAAEQGDAGAELSLGFMYSTTNTAFKLDNAEAVKWFQKSAQQGNNEAKIALNILQNPHPAPASNDYSEGWGSLAAVIWNARSNPQKDHVYNVTRMDGIKVQQVTEQGAFVTALYGPIETSGRVVFIYKGNGFGEGLVDGALIPPSSFQYVGTYSYNSLTGERTVYAFKAVRH
jgi:hypothetical protein